MKHMLLLLAIMPLLFAGCGSSEESYIDHEVRTFKAEPFVYEFKNSAGEVLISTPYTPVLLTCRNYKELNSRTYDYQYKKTDSSGETFHTATGKFWLENNDTYLELLGNGAEVHYRLENGVWIRVNQHDGFSEAPYPPAFYEVKTENK